MPHFITCNSFIGAAYAKVLAGYLRDGMSPKCPDGVKLDPSQPLYIIELGTGSGKFRWVGGGGGERGGGGAGGLGGGRAVRFS